MIFKFIVFFCFFILFVFFELSLDLFIFWRHFEFLECRQGLLLLFDTRVPELELIRRQPFQSIALLVNLGRLLAVRTLFFVSVGHISLVIQDTLLAEEGIAVVTLDWLDGDALAN
jgi:hypothetical protein